MTAVTAESTNFGAAEAAANKEQGAEGGGGGGGGLSASGVSVCSRERGSNPKLFGCRAKMESSLAVGRTLAQKADLCSRPKMGSLVSQKCTLPRDVRTPKWKCSLEGCLCSQLGVFHLTTATQGWVIKTGRSGSSVHLVAVVIDLWIRGHDGMVGDPARPTM